MSEMVYCTMQIAVPRAWIDLEATTGKVPWFIDDLSEAFFDGIENDFDELEDRVLVDIVGQLNYGSCAIENITAWLVDNQIPFVLHEEDGCEWDACWTSFNGYEHRQGLLCWNTGPVLSQNDILAARANQADPNTWIDDYFAFANLKLDHIVMPDQPADCPPRPKE